MNANPCSTHICECKSRRLELQKEFVRIAGQATYEELLHILPDSYYDQGELGKLRTWRRILRSARAGEHNLRKLARRVKA